MELKEGQLVLADETRLGWLELRGKDHLCLALRELPPGLSGNFLGI